MGMPKALLKIVFISGLASVNVFAQEKIFLYPPTQKVTINGFDKEPPFMEHFKVAGDSSTGSAVLICPGGAYTALADQHEGSAVAKFFNRHGFDAFVLHYRL